MNLLSSFLLPGALLEKKTDLDKRGMGMSDYSNGMNKPLVCRPSALSKDPSDRTTFLDKVRHLATEQPSGLFLLEIMRVGKKKA